MNRKTLYRRRRSERGSMLVEAAMSIAIMGSVSVACMSVVSATSAASDAARQNIVALNAARHVIENMRNFKGAMVPTGTYSDATAFGPVSELSQLNSASTSVIVSAPDSILKQAIITVSWRAGERSKTRTVTLTALLAANGVAP